MNKTVKTVLFGLYLALGLVIGFAIIAYISLSVGGPLLDLEKLVIGLIVTLYTIGLIQFIKKMKR